MATEITRSNFQSEVLDAKQRILLDFYASWCGPCQMLSPILDQVAEEAKNVKICKVNIDREPALAQQFNVMSVPSLFVLDKGQVVGSSVGVRPKQAILEMLAS